jgi:DtxR family transcriptional regulator, Mn-dependent transcriptional regulator
MLTFVGAQVDRFERDSRRCLHRVANRPCFPGKREHTAVVVAVRRAVQEMHPWRTGHGIRERINHVCPTPFAEVGDALDKPRHAAECSLRPEPHDYHGEMNRPAHGHAPEVSEAAQTYLLTLRSMDGGATPAMTAALARRMKVSTQAASEMVARLAHDGLVEVSSDRSLRLTGAGQAAADTIFRRHALMEWLLIGVIGLGWAESDEEAMRLQGAISPRVEEAIANLVGHPATCPHGNPIDAASARARPKGMTLAEAAPGTDVTVLRITEEAEEEADLLVYLEQEGLVPGVLARVVDVSAGRDSITLEGPHGRSTMGLRPAALIRVLPGRADAALFHRIPWMGADAVQAHAEPRSGNGQQEIT